MRRGAKKETAARPAKTPPMRRLFVVVAIACVAIFVASSTAWSASTAGCAANDVPCRTAARHSVQRDELAAPDAATRSPRADEKISVPGIILIGLAGVGTAWLLGARVRRRMIGI
jgi:hypothetical protein